MARRREGHPICPLASVCRVVTRSQTFRMMRAVRRSPGTHLHVCHAPPCHNNHVHPISIMSRRPVHCPLHAGSGSTVLYSRGGYLPAATRARGTCEIRGSQRPTGEGDARSEAR